MVKSEVAERRPPAERKRGLEDALAYAVGHRIRVDALAILAEGRHSPNEIAGILRKNVSTVARHVKELYDSGCIESVGTQQVRGATEHFYRAVTMPVITASAATVTTALPAVLSARNRPKVMPALRSSTRSSTGRISMTPDPGCCKASSTHHLLTWSATSTTSATPRPSPV